MKNIFTLSLIYLIFSATSVLAQTETKQWKIDSLTKVSATQKGSEKLKSLIALADEHMNAKTGKAESIIKNAEDLADNVGDLSLSNLLKGSKVRLWLQQDKIEEAEALAFETLEEAGRIGYVDGAIKSTNSLLTYYRIIANDLTHALKITDRTFIVAEKLKSDKMKVSLLMNYGSCYYYMGKIDECEKYYLLAADLYGKLGNKGKQAGALMNCGVVKFQNGFIKESISIYEKALKIFATVKDTFGMTQCYENIAMSYADLNDTRALDFYKKVEKLHLLNKDSMNLAGLYGNIGNYYMEKGNLSEAFTNYFKGLKLNERTKNNAGLVTSYLNVAKVYYALKRYKLALEYNAKAEEQAKKNQNQRSLAKVYVQRGSILIDMREYEKARYYYLKAQDIYIKEKIEMGIATINLSLGNVLTKLKNYKEAIVLYEKALAYRIKQDSKLEIAGLYSNIGVCYYEMGNFNKALDYYQKAFEIRQVGGNLEDVQDTYLTFSNLYMKQKDYKNAYTYFKKYSNLHDSLYSSGITKQMAEMQTEYDSDKKSAQIKLLEKDNKLAADDIKRKNTQRNILVGGIGVLLLLVGLIFFGYKEKKKSNLLLAQQKLLIEEKHKEMTDSINYAKRIQSAMLAGDDHWGSISKQHFILFRPKDVVSGDFYWAHYANDVAIWCTADCTGHGVPGAFMSMIGVAYLSQIVVEGKATDPAQVLNALREKIIRAMEQKGVAQQRDGMDISICMWNKKTNELKYAGANNSIYIIRDKELLEIKPDKMPIGAYTEELKPFNTKVMTLQVNDKIISFTDGYADQFGGSKGKKMMYKNFKTLLIDSSAMSMTDQKNHLEKNLLDWQGNFEQVDDVCVIGVSV